MHAHVIFLPIWQVLALQYAVPLIQLRMLTTANATITKLPFSIQASGSVLLDVLHILMQMDLNVHVSQDSLKMLLKLHSLVTVQVTTPKLYQAQPIYAVLLMQSYTIQLASAQPPPLYRLV